jgi:hypothetical protein
MSEEKETFPITSNENHALNMIKGLDQDVFHMVVAAKEMKGGGYLLEGSPEEFDKLTSDLFDEIEYKLSPKSRLKHLEKLYCRLTPDCDDF